MKKLSKKVMVSFLAVMLFVTMLLSGCGSKQGRQADSNAASDTTTKADTKKSGTKDTAPAEPVSIVVWTNLENETDTLKKYGEMWARETGNNVEIIHETSDLQQFAQAVKSSDGPDAVYGIANDQLANYVSAGLVEPVPDGVYKEEDYVDSSVQACYAEGIRYAVPIAVETNALFYNKDKIKEIPATWEELIQLAKENGGIKFDATSIYYDLGFLRAYDSYIFKYGDGAYDVSDIGLGDANAVKAYDFINQMADAGFFASDITSDLAKSSFQNGETAFYIGGPWDIDGFKSAGTPFAVAAMPALNGKNFVTPVGTQVGFVSAKSDAKDAVFDFFSYLMESSAQDMYTAGGRIPANKEEEENIPMDETNIAFITQISYGEPMPTVSELGQVWTPYSDNMKLMFEDKITPEAAAENIKTQVQEGIDLMNSGK